MTDGPADGSQSTEGEYEHMAKAQGMIAEKTKWFALDYYTQKKLRAKCKPFFSVDEGY